MQTVLVFILVLGVLVFFHELGHFLFAKRAGILVREFAIGFGPKLFAKRYGETLYSIRILPLGGYVRMAGEDPEMVEIKTGTLVYITKNSKGLVDHIYINEPANTRQPLIVGRVIQMDMEKECNLVLEDEQGHETKYSLDPKAIIHYDQKNEVQIAPLDRQFASKTVGQKAMTIFAGPLFNIILTLILFTVLAFQVGVEDQLVVDHFVKDAPAAKAGMKEGDVITHINGEKVSAEKLRYLIQESKGEPIQVTVQRNGQTLNLEVKPKKEEDVYLIGAVFDQSKYVKEPNLFEAVADSFKRTYDWTTIILDGFVKLVTGDLSIKSLAGPVQMGDMTGKIAKKGVDPLIQWTALLSLNLAIFNLLPIPALDGSRLVFIGIEAIRGRPVHPNKEHLVHLVGFALLMMLMLVVTYNDIMKIFFT
ncbi:RIP metalloprotease RseP [Thermoflavimicrobium dichotomicum]|uniref:Zinc metalloprotease n=1 Tax=Thermoflavimicrobium dichotomicum TaxID=46223 RepID=A0A1I3PNJ7_9BACL|nr:RIP metalloprotease RseP [Thermoflavimicrobium dichotomicum]SFJ23072.1 regulator of sigma E protease [Thermoflavimicrobium dichotomicum]